MGLEIQSCMKLEGADMRKDQKCPKPNLMTAKFVHFTKLCRDMWSTEKTVEAIFIIRNLWTNLIFVETEFVPSLYLVPS